MWFYRSYSQYNIYFDPSVDLGFCILVNFDSIVIGNMQRIYETYAKKANNMQI